MSRMILRRKVGWDIECVDLGHDILTKTESQAIKSTDLWDASTDSRFISRADGVNTVKKRR